MGKSPETDTSPSEVECAICKKRIPASTALSPEGHDYILYFCGGKCYARWERDEAAELERTFERRSGVKPS